VWLGILELTQNKMNLLFNWKHIYKTIITNIMKELVKNTKLRLIWLVKSIGELNYSLETGGLHFLTE
jgi:hypothetical protein